MVLEDLHWADEATLDFVRFSRGAFSARERSILVTYRDDEISAPHPVRVGVGELTGDHVTRMRLVALSLEACGACEGDRPSAPAWIESPAGIRSSCVKCSRAQASTCRKRCATRSSRGLTVLARRGSRGVRLDVARAERVLAHQLRARRRPEALNEAGGRGLLELQSESVRFRHELARLAVNGTLPPERVCEWHEQVLHALAEHGADMPGWCITPPSRSNVELVASACAIAGERGVTGRVPSRGLCAFRARP